MAKGLTLVGAGCDFIGEWWDNRCYAYSSGKCAGRAYYSTAGNSASMPALVGGDMYRPARYDFK